MKSRSGSTTVDRAAASETTPSPATRLPYLPGIDGLRALAVIAVLLYHGGLSVWGGFLGVETFFVLSGFLITALLLAEWRQHGSIKVTRFWLRRARRLLPALALLLAGTWLLVAMLLPEEMALFQRDMLAALGYITNWYLIASQQSYFDPAIRPPLLQHLWSLAIEEQFYLLWPFLFALGMRFLRQRGFLLAILGAAAASILFMASIADPGADPSRVYYGTDTRASALLIGSALALVWSPWHAAPTARRGAGLALDLVGFVALGSLLWSYLRLFEYHPLLYRGGFVLVSLATAVAIVAVTHPKTRLLPALLGLKPLTWIGLRSYGIYLWHWPIFMLTRPYIDVPIGGWQLFALQFAVVLVISDLSFRFVETPIRRGGLALFWQQIRSLGATPAPVSHLVEDGGGLAQSAEMLPAGSSAAMPAQVVAPILVESHPHALNARRARSQRHARNGKRRHHRRHAV